MVCVHFFANRALLESIWIFITMFHLMPLKTDHRFKLWEPGEDNDNFKFEWHCQSCSQYMSIQKTSREFFLTSVWQKIDLILIFLPVRNKHSIIFWKFWNYLAPKCKDCVSFSMKRNMTNVIWTFMKNSWKMQRKCFGIEVVVQSLL